MFIGVDACKQGWVAVAVGKGGYIAAGVFVDFTELAKRCQRARAIGVDMPIGLLKHDRREADASARNFLRGQSSSVFSAPVQSVLAEPQDYAAAQVLSRRDAGRGLSRQSHAIVAKIAEVARCVEEADEEFRAVLHEVHPEVSFRLMNGEEALSHRKKTWGGLHDRLALLKTEGIELPGSLTNVNAAGVEFARELADANAVGIDDVVDAAAAAWSARRVARGAARSFPKTPTQRDASGRVIAIWG